MSTRRPPPTTDNGDDRAKVELGGAGHDWTWAERTLAYDVLMETGRFPEMALVTDLARTVERSVAAARMKLFNLLSARAAGQSGLSHKSNVDDLIVATYRDRAQLRTAADQIRRALAVRPVEFADPERPISLRPYQPLAGPVRVKDSTAVLDPKRRRVLLEKALRDHAKLLARICAALVESGATCWEDSGSVDLLARWDDGRAALIEVKSRRHEPVTWVRAGLSQLYEYEYRLNEGRPLILALALPFLPRYPEWLVRYVTAGRGVNLVVPTKSVIRVIGPDAAELAARCSGFRVGSRGVGNR
jgi:hypothetical protein